MCVIAAAALLATGCKKESDPELCVESGTVCTVAGTGAPGQIDKETDPLKSPLYGPMDITLHGGGDGFFISDWNNHKIRWVHDGQVETIIGTDFLGDGDPDFEERNPPGVPGTTVALNHPTSAEWNPVTGKLLLPSWHNHRVRQWDPATGNSLVVCADTDINDGNGANAGFSGDGGPAADALMAFPNSIAIDPASGDFWVLPQSNNRIRWVAGDFSLIDTIAGDGERGYYGDGGDPLKAAFHFWEAEDLQPEPAGAVEYDADRHMLYVADTSNHVIRSIDLDSGVIDTLPGTGEQTLAGGVCDTEALCYPRDVEILGDVLYIADEGNHVVRAYDLVAEAMDVVVGTFEQGDGEDGADALDMPLNQPYGIDVAEDGTLYIADTYNHRIKRVTQ